MTAISPAALEEAAKAFQSAYHEHADTLEGYEAMLTAAITAYLAQREKEGFVMVPTFPTLVMMNAAGKAIAAYIEKMAASGGVVEASDYALRAVIHRAMLAAAQNGGE